MWYYQCENYKLRKDIYTENTTSGHTDHSQSNKKESSDSIDDVKQEYGLLRLMKVSQIDPSDIPDCYWFTYKDNKFLIDDNPYKTRNDSNRKHIFEKKRCMSNPSCFNHNTNTHIINLPVFNELWDQLSCINNQINTHIFDVDFLPTVCCNSKCTFTFSLIDFLD